MCICVFEIQLGTGRPHKCVRACVCLSLGQVARTLARACLSPGTGAHICARAGLRLSLGQVARRKNNVCVCVLSLGQVVRTLRARACLSPGQVAQICVCRFQLEVGTGHTHMCV